MAMFALPSNAKAFSPALESRNRRLNMLLFYTDRPNQNLAAKQNTVVVENRTEWTWWRHKEIGMRYAGQAPA